MRRVAWQCLPPKGGLSLSIQGDGLKVVDVVDLFFLNGADYDNQPHHINAHPEPSRI
jgi:hypothetical protein